MTTPAQPESKTPITDNARFSATTERPYLGDYELDVVQAEVAEKLETELSAAHIQAEAGRREIERLKAYLRGTEASHVEACFKLAEEFGHSKFSSEPPLEFVRKQLATAQQRIKELEADKAGLKEIVVLYTEYTALVESEKREAAALQYAINGTEPPTLLASINLSTRKSQITLKITEAINAQNKHSAAMSREPKEGEAK